MSRVIENWDAVFTAVRMRDGVGGAGGAYDKCVVEFRGEVVHIWTTSSVNESSLGYEGWDWTGTILDEAETCRINRVEE